MSASWDVAVIGGGPAGAMAAREIARAGARTILVEKRPLPRGKVCGCCVNGAAMATLERAGLGERVRALGAVPTRELRWWAGGRCARVPLQRGVSVSRSAFDMALVDAAQWAGAVVRSPATAAVQHVDDEHVHLAIDGAPATARIVVAADGLGGRALDALPGFAATVQPASRMGAGTLLADADLPAGVIQMACGVGGYVGIVRLEDGRVDVAAAFDPDFMRTAGGPGAAAAAVLHEAGAAAPADVRTAAWKGTPLLTRRRPVAGQRIFVVGDAAGYVEPFTGEGMAWALAGGVAVAPLAVAGVRHWHHDIALQWTSRHARLIRRRQRLCRVAAWTLRRPRLVTGLAGLIGMVPALAAPATGLVSRPAALHPTGAPA